MITAVQRKSWADDLLNLTTAMLCLLESGQELGGLDEMEVERERLVAAIFTDLESDCVGDGAWIAALHEVQALNDQLVGRSIEERDRASRELLTFMRAQKAGSAYAHATDESQGSSF